MPTYKCPFCGTENRPVEATEKASWAGAVFWGIAGAGLLFTIVARLTFLAPGIFATSNGYWQLAGLFFCCLCIAWLVSSSCTVKHRYCPECKERTS
jgi:hypothetical protein